MLHDLQHIPLADLKLSKLNVRRHGPKDIGSLAASIAALGLIQPLLVRNGGDGFEIVAGQRRYLAMKRLDAEGAPETGTLPCVVMEATDDAAAIESSLAENVARLPMDEIDQYEAFAALKKTGLGEAEIAGHFAISETLVKRRLAIANLHPDIRRRYRAGDIDAQTLHLLTLATRDRQKAWLALASDPEQTPPPPWQLKAWLLGGAEIATKAALFDEALYQGPITADLFGEERYFTDPEEFWRLQKAAIADERDRLLAAGWSEVHIVAPDQRFQSWDYAPASKAKGGGVFIDVEPDGQVTVHKGFLPQAQARRGRPVSVEGEHTDVAASAPRPEMTAPLANYVDLIRHSAVRLAIADAPEIALRLMLAHVIGGGRLWQVDSEPQRPSNPAISEAIAALPAQAAFAERRRETAALLGLDETASTVVQGRPDGEITAAVFARLLNCPDAEVMSLLAVVMAETLAAGTQLIDGLGAILKVDVGQHWQPDATFFELAKDREAVSEMLAEVIGAPAAKCHLTDSGSQKKTIIKMALAGDGRSKVEAWTPCYMQFPQAAYTARPLTASARPSA